MIDVKLIDNYWVIGSNKWNASIYTQEQAEKYSKTLINCQNCINCSDCSYCRSCSDCSYFKTNPQRITSSFLGSRNSQTTYYWDDKREQIICGCFKGTLEEFEEKVKITHGDNDFAKGYFKWIELVRMYRGGQL